MNQALLNHGSDLISFGGSPMGYLGMLVGSTMISLMLLAAVVRMRGQSPALLVSCVRDFLIGCGLAVTVLGLGVALFFIGRAFWKAAVYTK